MIFKVLINLSRRNITAALLLDENNYKVILDKVFGVAFNGEPGNCNFAFKGCNSD